MAKRAKKTSSKKKTAGRKRKQQTAAEAAPNETKEKLRLPSRGVLIGLKTDVDHYKGKASSARGSAAQAVKDAVEEHGLNSYAWRVAHRLSGMDTRTCAATLAHLVHYCKSYGISKAFDQLSLPGMTPGDEAAKVTPPVQTQRPPPQPQAPPPRPQQTPAPQASNLPRTGDNTGMAPTPPLPRATPTPTPSQPESRPPTGQAPGGPVRMLPDGGVGQSRET